MLSTLLGAGDRKGERCSLCPLWADNPVTKTCSCTRDYRPIKTKTGTSNTCLRTRGGNWVDLTFMMKYDFCRVLKAVEWVWKGTRGCEQRHGYKSVHASNPLGKVLWSLNAKDLPTQSWGCEFYLKAREAGKSESFRWMKEHGVGERRVLTGLQ